MDGGLCFGFEPNLSYSEWLCVHIGADMEVVIVVDAKYAVSSIWSRVFLWVCITCELFWVVYLVFYHNLIEGGCYHRRY